MHIKTFVFVVAFVISGCAGTAETDDQQAAGQIVDAEQGTHNAQVSDSNSYDPDAIKCKRIKETGTRFTTKVCNTNREWEQAEELAEDKVRVLQEDSQIGLDEN